MKEDPDSITGLSPLNPIRVETALSRYPVHRLSRKGNIDIDIREENEHGETATRWEVDYSKKHGQPGPLAYKLDTLIINRRIEEAARPIPKLIKLGSLRDICRELGLSEGENVNTIRKALRQNAFAGITAETSYQLSDGTERTLKADFTRYSVVFTGEKLPDGRRADAVYLILNDIYMQVLNEARSRPLDYDYLKSLAPAPQRFYELLSYRMYGALQHDRPRAKLIYSEFCTHAPQTRHFDWERVRSQMNKVHRPHRQSGYIVAIDSNQTTDKDGQPDWIMLYQPGPKAVAEYRAFTNRSGPGVTVIEPEPQAKPAAYRATQLLLDLEMPPLAMVLTEREVTRSKALELVQQYPAELIEQKIEVFDWLAGTQDKRIARNPAGYLCDSIRKNYATPKGFISRAQRAEQEETRQARERKAAEETRQRRQAEAREQAEREAAEAEIKRLTPAERTALEAEAMAQASPGDRQLYDDPPTPTWRQTAMHRMLREYVIRQLRSRETLPAEALVEPS